MHATIAILSALTLLARAVPLQHPNPFAHGNRVHVARQAAAAASSSVAPAPSASAIPTSSGGKTVVAHVIVGNTYPYTVSDWERNVKLAYANGIDGFALNIGNDDWTAGHVADAYQAAQQSGTGFKLFFSFDMSVLPCGSPDGATTLRNYINQYASHPNQLQVDGKSFASTFAGESCTFGQGSVPSGWASQFTQHPETVGKVKFAPSFFVDPTVGAFNQFQDVMNGDFNFNGGWAVTVTAQSPPSILDDIASLITSVDDQYISGLNAIPNPSGEHKTYMTAVSPWFFTHYSPATYNKNWIYDSEDHLYPTRWESIIQARDKIDIVEVVTWNDYGESHYIGPVDGALPLNAGDWVNGLSHAAFLDMTSYYATAFKTGSYPKITQDKLYAWTRTHPKEANAPDPVGKPTNYELMSDEVQYLVFATAPSTVTLSTTGSDAKTSQVPAGVSKLSIPIAAGGSIQSTISRSGATIVNLASSNFTFNGSPSKYNYNAYSAHATSN